MRAWEDFLIEQEKELGAETVNKWLRPLKIIRFDACNIYLEANDSFKALWFEEHMRQKTQMRLFNNNRKPIKVHITITSSKPSEEGQRKKALPTPPLFNLQFDNLNPQFTLETFLPSKGNLLAYKLIQESCQLSSKQDPLPLPFNPLYIFGRSGSGKTHLLMAAAHAYKAVGKQVIYVRSETFTEHVVNAIRTGEMQIFRKTYRHVDALLIDDIEVFGRKGATQEELFHTFNTLHTEGKQIIITGNAPPQELKWIEPRLISRFEWGIVVPLQSLGKEELKAILLKKAENASFALDENLIEFFLDSFGNNTKSLVRAFEALILRTHLSHYQKPALAAQGPLPLPIIKQLLADLIQEEEKATLTPGKIIRTVAEYYGIRIDDILSKSQSREYALPRQIAMHLCRERLKLPYMKIGDIFSRDHSTVMSSVKHIQKGLEEKEIEISNPVNGILKLL